jgi:hypothetical protein
MLVERAGNKAAQHVFFPTSTYIIIQNRVGAIHRIHGFENGRVLPHFTRTGML